MSSTWTTKLCESCQFNGEKFEQIKTYHKASIRIITSNVSNTCIMYDWEGVFNEFSTLNLISVDHMEGQAVVMVSVRKVASFAQYELHRYYMLFNADQEAADCYKGLSKLVHKIRHK